MALLALYVFGRPIHDRYKHVKITAMQVDVEPFGTQVRARRERLGWTQRQLGWRVACAEITLRKIESGQRAASARLVQLLADALGFAPAERERHLQEALTRNVRIRKSKQLAALEGVALTEPKMQADGARLLEMARELNTIYPDGLKDRLVSELTEQLPNLRACLRWLMAHDSAGALVLTGALREFWIKSGLFSEGRGWLEQALMLDISPNAARADALLAAGSLAFFQSDYAHAERRLAEYDLLSARLPGSARTTGLGLRLGLQGWIALHGHWRVADALAYFNRAIAHFESLGDDARAANIECDKAIVMAYAPRGASADNDPPRQAILLAQRADATFERLGNESSQAYAWIAAASAHEVLGNLEDAERLVMQALRVRRACQNRRDLAWALAQLAHVRNQMGRSDDVRALLEEATLLFREMGEKKAVCHVLQMHARMERAANKPEIARRLMAASIQTGLELHDVMVISKGLLDAAALALDESNALHAAELLAIADSIVPADNTGMRADYARMLERVDATGSALTLEAARIAARRVKLADVAEMVLTRVSAAQL